MTATTAKKDQILHAILPHIAFDGWSEAALNKAIDGKNIKIIDVMQVFPGGIADVLAYFSAWGIEQTQGRLAKRKLINMRVRDRVIAGVEAWLAVMAPHREAVRAALKRNFNPLYARHGTRSLHNLSSAIWYEAGDNATDFNYYTKRLLLSGVLATTIPYWLNDTSDSFANTHQFLQARVDNVLRVGKFIAQAKSMTQNAKQFKNIYDKFQGVKK